MDNLELLNIMEKMQKVLTSQDQQIQNLNTSISLLQNMVNNLNERNIILYQKILTLEEKVDVLKKWKKDMCAEID